MVNESEVFEKIRELVVSKLDVDEDEVTMEASFQEDLGADSLDVMELVDDLENEFQISIEEADLDKIKTVGDAVRYIASR
ncbi:MAG: acyl carrier protein [Bacillota bacterium]|nr:acyl carrier protein [Bacillota bacterium]HOB91780.1 acyl carrier protein [Bacillota bacterium]HPZ55196.1 acyl carrier protein [Bacillota bacterium]HQD18611.1 acyl carrier protein [Bacillota bacterium]